MARVYDDEKTTQHQNPLTKEDSSKMTGGSNELRDAEARADTGASQSKTANDGVGKSDLQDAETSVPRGNQGFYKPGNRKSSDVFSRFRNSLKDRRKTSRNIVLAGLVGGGFISLIVGIFGFLNVFKLDHLLSNLETRATMRYQVDLDNRSSKFISAYMTMRMGEIDNPRIEPQNRDNIMFRASRVDNNKPLTDWYKTLRASNFEKDIFENQGIKFTSVAVKRGNTIVMRPGIIRINDNPVTFNLSSTELRGIDNVDPNLLNGRLKEFVELEILEGGDKEARKKIKEAVKAQLKPWQVVKKRNMRKHIQNMTGVRDWRFFETSRNKFAEKRRDVRNKIIVKSLPESTRSGKFIQCMFGIISCRSSSDPSSPENRSASATKIGDRAGESIGQEGEDGTSNQTPVSDGDDDMLSEAMDESMNSDDGNDNQPRGIQKRIISSLISKFSSAVGWVSALDTLSRIDESIQNGSLSKMVTAARAAQAVGVFTTYSIARDQLKTGEVTSDEVGDMMSRVNNAGNSEAAAKFVSSDMSTDKVSAAESFSQKKQNYCTEEYQADLKEDDFHYLCDDYKIGGSSNAKSIEDWWKNSSFGSIVSGMLSVYRNSIGGFVGSILDFAGDIVGSIVSPVVSGILSITGLKDDAESAMAWMLGKTAEKLGAGPMIDTDTPEGVVTNMVAQGATYTAESTTRQYGGALSTEQTRKRTSDSIVAYLNNQQDSRSLYDRYVSLDNHSSFFASQLYSISTSNPSLNLSGFVSSIIKTSASLSTLSLNHAYAQSFNGYAMADFAGIETYDMPNACVNRNPMEGSLINATNADDLGLINESDITWELLTDANAFYDKLYENDPSEDVAKNVYNCALFDSTVMVSLGYTYGYTDSNEIESSKTDDEVAQEQNGFNLLDSVNGYKLSPKESEHIKYIAENVFPKLSGKNDQKILLASQVTWWSLKEGVLALDDPFGYSNCQIPLPGSRNAGEGSNYIGLTQTCPRGNAWQVGIGAIQVPDFTLSRVEQVAKQRHPDKDLKDVLGDVAKLAGAEEGTEDYQVIVNSKGDARKSFLLRDPATSFTLVGPLVKSQCIDKWESWCGAPAVTAKLHTPKERSTVAIEELKSYFSSPSSRGGVSSSQIIGNPLSSSADVPCPSGTKDVGIHDAYLKGSRVEMRLCAVENLSCGNEECTAIGGGKALVSSRVAGAVYTMVEDAKKAGLTLTANSTFRTHSHQQSLWNANPNPARVARPGYSFHQSGNAIDFGNMGGTAQPSRQSCSNRMTWHTAEWKWLRDNAKKYGYKQYSAESWHWDTSEEGNRC